MAIDTGSKPVLFADDDIPWPLVLPSNFATLPAEKVSSKQHWREADNFPNKLDPELAAVWAAMSKFCALVNAAAEEGGVKMAEEAFLHSTGSIMYRLLHQRYGTGSLDEAFRLGLLAFSSPIFLNWNRVELLDRQFTSAYRDALTALHLIGPNVAPQERLWLLMVGALSMSHEPKTFAWLRPWLRMNIELCNVFTWEGMRESLSSLLWVGLVYDKAGNDVFDLILPQYEGLS